MVLALIDVTVLKWVVIVKMTIRLLIFFMINLFLENPSASRAELMMMTVSDIVSQLITAHEKGSDVNLNK